MLALLPHVDDEMFLAPQFQESTFEQRAQLLYLNWKVLHAVDALHDIKAWLIHLHAAYWVTVPVTTLSFDRTKANFWNAINHAGTFVSGPFVITPDVPLVSITVESLLVRTVGQWIICRSPTFGMSRPITYSSSIRYSTRCTDRHGQLLFSCLS